MKELKLLHQNSLKTHSVQQCRPWRLN